jgi:hemoglobin-like flavoprotein
MLNAAVLRENFQIVVERCPDLGHRFYEIFFMRYPQVKGMFGHGREALARQEKMLTDALVAVMDHLDDAPWLVQTLRTLGARHVDYGVKDEMYGWVGASLLEALAEASGPAWTQEVATAWTDAFNAIAGLMLEGAHTARRAAAG